VREGVRAREGACVLSRVGTPGRKRKNPGSRWRVVLRVVRLSIGDGLVSLLATYIYIYITHTHTHTHTTHISYIAYIASRDVLTPDMPRHAP